MHKNRRQVPHPFQAQVPALYNRRGRGRLAVRVIDNIFSGCDRASILEDAFHTFTFRSVLGKDRDQNVAALHLSVVLQRLKLRHSQPDNRPNQASDYGTDASACESADNGSSRN